MIDPWRDRRRVGVEQLAEALDPAVFGARVVHEPRTESGAHPGPGAWLRWAGPTGW
ncbi:MAG: hypothetical protein M5U14_16585 [Acidimicrobiia bacterium]|nr:hypothetical protein [Acidimicrobiia bacterium]